jgi:hypothetical protein
MERRKNMFIATNITSLWDDSTSLVSVLAFKFGNMHKGFNSRQCLLSLILAIPLKRTNWHIPSQRDDMSVANQECGRTPSQRDGMLHFFPVLDKLRFKKRIRSI